MGLKVRTNASRKKSEKSDKNDNPKVKNTEKNPSFNVREISNGWLVSKSWTDEEGNYKSEEIYHADKPAGLDSLAEGE